MPAIEVILNASSGIGDDAGPEAEVSRLFEEHGLDITLRLARTGEELLQFAIDAAKGDAEIVVAGGGDGTVSAVAAAISETGKTLGVLPLGTLNHFAKDLQIPLDLEQAVSVIVGGRIVDVDVGEVNGRIFINNSSIGIYPAMVRGREMRQRLGFGKWHSLFRSTISVFRRYPLFGVRLKSDENEIVTRTPFIFIGNNDYAIESFSLSGRNRLDEGKLSVYMTRRSGRLAMLRIALKTIFGGLSQDKDFLSVLTETVTLETRRARIRVALDGEVELMKTPLEYSIRPAALRVFVAETYDSGNGETAK